MSLIIILVIECLIWTLPTVKISFHIFIHCDVTWYLWKLTNNQNAISAQEANSFNITQTNRGVEFIIFSREKHISWTIFGLNHRMDNKQVEKSSSCLKRVKNSLERVKLLIQELITKLSTPEAKSSLWTDGTKCSFYQKEYNIFWCCKKSKLIILLIFVYISRVVVTL